MRNDWGSATVQSVSEDTSLRNRRFPEIAGCAQVARTRPRRVRLQRSGIAVTEHFEKGRLVKQNDHLIEFLMVKREEATDAASALGAIVIVENWFEELTDRVPVP